MKTAAVIVNYRTKELTLDAVRSVLGEPDVDAVVVVDNASGDGSAAYLRQAVTDGRFRVLESDTNRGYGPAVNLAVAACASPLVLVMNSDATLLPGSMSRLTKVVADDDRVAVVAPAVYGPGGQHLQPGVYGRLPTRRDVFLTLRWVRTRADDPLLAREPEWVSGVAMLVRRSDFVAVNGFDERFTMYLEDVDLCRRLREVGRSIRREPAAGVVHLLGRSWTSRQDQRRCFHESKIRYFEKLGASHLELACARLVGRLRAAPLRSPGRP